MIICSLQLESDSALVQCDLSKKYIEKDGVTMFEKLRNQVFASPSCKSNSDNNDVSSSPRRVWLYVSFTNYKLYI